jgi:hypothetical protein
VIAATRGRLYESIEEVKLLRVRRATIDADAPMTFFGDGETLVRNASRLDVELAGGPLCLIGPRPVEAPLPGRHARTWTD